MNILRSEEGVLLFGMLIASVYMFVEAFNFPRDGRLFPQMTTGVVIIGCILLLSRDILPRRISTLFLDKTDSTQTDDDSLSKEISIYIDKKVMTFVLAVVYVGIGYLVGLLWATPIAMALYAKLYDLSTRKTMVVIAVGTSLALVFMVLIDVPFYEGILTEGIL